MNAKDQLSQLIIESDKIFGGNSLHFNLCGNGTPAAEYDWQISLEESSLGWLQHLNEK